MKSHPIHTYETIDQWIAGESIPFSADSPNTSNVAVDKVIASLSDSVELLGFGEALHSGEEILELRNRLFQRLAEAHGFSAIAIESSFPRAHVTNKFVAGRGPTSYEEIGTGIGVSDQKGIREPEASTLEARLIATPGPLRFTPLTRGKRCRRLKSRRFPFVQAAKRIQPIFRSPRRASLILTGWRSLIQLSTTAAGRHCKNGSSPS
jgi:hypothetical protein